MIRDRPELFRGRHFADEVIVLCVRWYLRYSLSYRDLAEMMMERHLSVDPSTIWRWVQRYAPELNMRIRRELKPTNGSWRTDETYVRVAGRWTYLYRAVDSTGATIDFFLSQSRDVSAAQTFFRKGLAAPNHPRPRVINVDGNPSYPKVIYELKRSCTRPAMSLPRCSLSQQYCRAGSPCNQTTDQCEPRVPLFRRAERTIQGYAAMHMIRKGQIRRLVKGDATAQIRFIQRIFRLAA